MLDRQEIIKTLCKIEGFFSGCRDNAHEGSQFKALFQGYMDAVHEAAELLKPVKPEKRELPYGMYDAVKYEYKCGACGCGLMKNEKWRANSCPGCGKAVKWE